MMWRESRRLSRTFIFQLCWLLLFSEFIGHLDAEEIRLAGGSKPNEGRVEINQNGTWGTFCGISMSVKIAIVLCRQAGYPGAAMAFGNNTKFGSGIGSVYYIGYKSCRGDETRFSECHFGKYTYTDCDHTHDAGVVCLEPGYQGCYSSGSNFQSFHQASSSANTVDECLSICNGTARSLAALSINTCFCSNKLPFVAPKSTDDNCNYTCRGDSSQICGSETHMSVFSTTDGFCQKLSPPENGFFDTNATRFGTTVTVHCHRAYELEGTKRLQCVADERHSDQYTWTNVTSRPTCKETILQTAPPDDTTRVGVIVGVMCSLLLVGLVITLLFVYCRYRSKFSDRKSFYNRTSWGLVHLGKDQADAEPHTYESASQGRASFHSSPRHRTTTVGGISEHLYADYHEFHEDKRCDEEDTCLLTSQTEKRPNGRLVNNDAACNGSVMVTNELYNPSTSRDYNLNDNVYEIGDDFRASRKADKTLYDEPSIKGKPSTGEHIYEPEPVSESSFALDKDPMYSSADYAVVDTRDSGLGTLTMNASFGHGVRRDDATASSEVPPDSAMVDNELYVTSENPDANESLAPRDSTFMVENVLYQPQT